MYKTTTAQCQFCVCSVPLLLLLLLRSPGVPSTQSRMWSQAEEAADRAELRPRACGGRQGGQGRTGWGRGTKHPGILGQLRPSRGA
jgi:hypothetical protein